jgi:hypothetical protein
MTARNRLLKAVLECASRGWPVLRLHSANDSRCSRVDPEGGNAGTHPESYVSGRPPEQLKQDEGQSAESIADKAKAERLATLEAAAVRSIARGREANIGLGRAFLQIKAIGGHGRWERYFAERYVSRGIAKRRAQTYMDLARETANSRFPDHLSQRFKE